MNSKTKAKAKPAPVKSGSGVLKGSNSAAPKPKRGLVATFPPAKKGEVSDALAKFAISPKAQAAVTVKAFSGTFGELELMSLADGLGESIKAVQGGEMKECEAMLMGQAHSLQAIFRNLAAQAQANIGHYPKAVDSYLRLALKAQSQCRATLETLSAIKNPPVLFAKQANFANGPQQVNNGTPAGKVETVQNKLMEAQDAEWVDAGTESQTGGSHSPLETLGAKHRAED